MEESEGAREEGIKERMVEYLSSTFTNDACSIVEQNEGKGEDESATTSTPRPMMKYEKLKEDDLTMVLRRQCLKP